MNKYSYNSRQKFLFLIRYLFYKFLVLFEVEKPKVQMFLFDASWSLINLLFTVIPHKQYMKLIEKLYLYNSMKLVKTKFGIFNIRPYTQDPITISPSFERGDVNYLLKNIKKYINSDKRVLFLDIGADLGYYTITLTNYFRNSKLFTVYAIEPSISSRKYLLKNIRLNHANRVKVFPCAIYRRNNLNIRLNVNINAQGSNTISSKKLYDKFQQVTTRTIDKIVLSSINEYDVLFIKIDIEGFEIEALKGAKRVIDSGKDVYIMVEDCVNTKVIQYLNNSNAIFLGKFNNYNSWWKFTDKF